MPSGSLTAAVAVPTIGIGGSPACDGQILVIDDMLGLFTERLAREALGNPLDDQRGQDRLDPLWSRLAGGCHLNRKMDDLISRNGFRIEALENARLPGPRTHTYLYQGLARPA
jgi:hypothetical protein